MSLAAACALAAGCSSAGTPTGATAAISPITETFSSQLSPRGTASRVVQVHDAGTVSVSLTSTTPSSLRLGLGIGIPKSTGAPCGFTTTAMAVAGDGTTLSIDADTGQVCVGVFDPGVLAAQAGFTLTIAYP